jgi:Flp pilus assembly protein TadG
MRAPSWIAPPRARRFGVEDGSVAVEFAFIGPLLILVLSGIFTYGGYFLTAHTVQQIANDAARAAIAGLDDDERQQIASTSAAQDIATQTFMRGDLKAVTVTRAGDMVTVGVSYDAREDVYWAFAALLPVPSPLIARSATIRVGGY